MQKSELYKWPELFYYLDVSAELTFVGFFVFLLKRVHVFGNMSSHDVLFVNRSIKVSVGESWESLKKISNLKISEVIQPIESSMT